METRVGLRTGSHFCKERSGLGVFPRARYLLEGLTKRISYAILRTPSCLRPFVACFFRALQVNNILQARNEELEKTMAAKGVGFLEEAAKAEGAVKTDRCDVLFFTMFCCLRPDFCPNCHSTIIQGFVGLSSCGGRTAAFTATPPLFCVCHRDCLQNWWNTEVR